MWNCAGFYKKRHDNFFCCVSIQVFLPMSRQRQAAKNLYVKSYRLVALEVISKFYLLHSASEGVEVMILKSLNYA